MLTKEGLAEVRLPVCLIDAFGPTSLASWDAEDVRLEWNRAKPSRESSQEEGGPCIGSDGTFWAIHNYADAPMRAVCGAVVKRNGEVLRKCIPYERGHHDEREGLRWPVWIWVWGNQ